MNATSRSWLLRQGALVLLRVAVGWHFLYEGITRLSDSDWTSATYLELPGWVFAPIIRWIASAPALLAMVDFLSTWVPILIGLGLVLGCFTRLTAAAGVCFFLLFYVAHPPFVGLALFVALIFPTGSFLGLDRLIDRYVRKTGASGDAGAVSFGKEPAPGRVHARREMLRSLAAVPFLGAFVVAALKGRGWRSFEEEGLAEKEEPAGTGAAAEEVPDAVTSATVKSFEFPKLKDLKGTMPQAKIGDLDLSRMILGGNLIGGWAHARDLIYVSKLVKAYHHKWKVFETLLLAEKCGVNAILTNPSLCGVINDYWKRKIGKIRFISDCGGADLQTMVRKSIDNGASACYVQGGTADSLVQHGQIDKIEMALELMRENGLPAGIGAHSLETVKDCVEFGLEPDFWMKTLHHHNYWSAKPKNRHDNVWCEKPDETIAFMAKLPQPWIAFKVLGAGAIHPKDGFRYAFNNGADFICVGMYDFQVVEDVNIAVDVLKGDIKRERPWRA